MKSSSQPPVRMMFSLFLLWLVQIVHGQNLKSIVYDFDGFDNAAVSLPEGEYGYGDLSYAVSANPLQQGNMLGDRCIRLTLKWNNGYAAFGRGIARFVELDPNADHFNFYFYNPNSNNQSAHCEISIADDDNQNGTFESASDDLWKKNIILNTAAGWQLYSLPLSGFSDDNAGGNGIFDIAFSQNQGMLLLTEFRFDEPQGNVPDPEFYLDMISFSEGPLSTGNSILDLPPKQSGDHCLLGAFQPESGGNNHLIPAHVEGLFPSVQGHRLKYVNTYLQWSYNSTTPNTFPGNSIQTLINNGYRPIITWEPMFLQLAPLDPSQPNLDKILNGDYDSYIDAFAGQMMSYTDTVIIRFMHEFDGDWYPWCISQNGQDPAKFVAVFQKVVDIFKTKGATKVKWMWCPNSDYAPYESYNWIVDAYPGNGYVDYVATDIYNGHYPASLPWWRSFRWQATEVVYYLSKYFPAKPLIICELGCRERLAGEDPGSQSKADWFKAMDAELQSNFRQVRGLIFFNSGTGTSQDWKMNSSVAALESLRDNIWYDSYYFSDSHITGSRAGKTESRHFSIFPNPATDQIYLQPIDGNRAGSYEIIITDLQGRTIHRESSIFCGPGKTSFPIRFLEKGTYFVTVNEQNGENRQVQGKCLLVHD